MMEEGKRNHIEEPDSSTHPDDSQKTSETESSLPVAVGNLASRSLSSLLPKALNAVLHPKLSADRNSEPEPSRDPPKHTTANLQQLQLELKDLREQFDQMKSQHNKEIKLLMNELDEEKRIRLTLQMEIQRMKKRMSK